MSQAMSCASALTCARASVARQQRRLGMGLVQVLEDGHGLAQPVAVVQHQRGHEVRHLLVGEGLGELLFLARWMDA
jgi:hypothetical protein